MKLEGDYHSEGRVRMDVGNLQFHWILPCLQVEFSLPVFLQLVCQARFAGLDGTSVMEMLFVANSDIQELLLQLSFLVKSGEKEGRIHYIG